MIDDCHATGFLGAQGRGTHEYWNLLGEIDIITGTLGKALGGASGGYTSGRKEIVEFLRQRSRPYLFSNALCPIITSASLEVFRLLEKEGTSLRSQLFQNASYFREKMTKLGFKLAGKDHPIIPVMLGDAKLTQEFAKRMLDQNIYVVGFFFPVVPKGQARIRTQMSAAHTKEDLDKAINAFENVGKELGVL
jgi:glycine C-acetyltransferase